MSILQNAVDSIAIGLEDFESEDKRRLLSATRNIFAGILLLFKHKLSELSPPGSDEVLIKDKVVPRWNKKGEVFWQGKGKKTVDVRNIEERFESLDIKVDWEIIYKIRNYRNNIEHYYENQEKNAIQKIISDSFIVISDFITNYLDGEPAEVLGQDYYKILLDTNEVYEKEKRKCINQIFLLKYPHESIPEILSFYSCDNCGSDLITPTGHKKSLENKYFKCKACGQVHSYSKALEASLMEYFIDEFHIDHYEGSGDPIISCLPCGHYTYIVHEEICFFCGDKTPLDEVPIEAYYDPHEDFDHWRDSRL